MHRSEIPLTAGGLHKSRNRIPPTAVGGWFRSFLLRGLSSKRRNPAHGSVWMVQVLSTKRRSPIELPNPTPRQCVVRSSSIYSFALKGLEPIHTLPCVGFLLLLESPRSRKDLNHPHTAVCGI